MIISKSGLVRFHLGDVQTSSLAQPCLEGRVSFHLGGFLVFRVKL